MVSYGLWSFPQNMGLILNKKAKERRGDGLFCGKDVLNRNNSQRNSTAAKVPWVQDE
jgi:hypothetical protein